MLVDLRHEWELGCPTGHDRLPRNDSVSYADENLLDMDEDDAQVGPPVGSDLQAGVRITGSSDFSGVMRG
jgi:hypothetical protein